MNSMHFDFRHNYIMLLSLNYRYLITDKIMIGSYHGISDTIMIDSCHGILFI